MSKLHCYSREFEMKSNTYLFIALTFIFIAETYAL